MGKSGEFHSNPIDIIWILVSHMHRLSYTINTSFCTVTALQGYKEIHTSCFLQCIIYFSCIFCQRWKK